MEELKDVFDKPVEAVGGMAPTCRNFILYILQIRPHDGDAAKEFDKDSLALGEISHCIKNSPNKEVYELLSVKDRQLVSKWVDKIVHTPYIKTALCYYLDKGKKDVS